VYIIPEGSWLFKQISLIGMRINAKRSHTPLTTLTIGVYATEHCNLNCKCCTAFSPIAKESFLDIQSFTKDMARLATLTGNRLSSFYVSGGEPLLHPRLMEIFEIARRYFPEAVLGFMTNGLLLTQMPDSFWEQCSKYAISINISRYPININMNKIFDKVKQYDAMLKYTGGNDIPIKTLWKYPLDITGKQPLKRSYEICTQLNRCITLKDGKIYPCSAIAGIVHFNTYFNKDLQLSADDVLDLYEVKDIKEVFNFLCSPKPFCRYCNRKGVTFGIKYSDSKKEIEEWT